MPGMRAWADASRWITDDSLAKISHNYAKVWTINQSKGAFLWNDPDQDQWSEITRIILDQINRWIHSGQGFIGSLDLPWSEWSRITDPDPDHSKGTHPKSLPGFWVVTSLESMNGLFIQTLLRGENGYNYRHKWRIDLLIFLTNGATILDILKILHVYWSW